MSKPRFLLAAALQLILICGAPTVEDIPDVESCNFLQVNSILEAKGGNLVEVASRELHQNVNLVQQPLSPKLSMVAEVKLETMSVINRFNHLMAGAYLVAMLLFFSGITASDRFGRRMAQIVFLLGGMLTSGGFAVLLPISYSFAKALGQGAAASGFLVSAYPMGGICGQVYVRKTMLPESGRPGGSYKELRSFTFRTLFLMGLSTWAYISVVFTPLRANPTVLWYTLLFLRAAAGFLNSISGSAAQFLALNVTPKHEVMTLMTIAVGCRNFGITFGVIISSIVLWFVEQTHAANIWVNGTAPLMPIVLITLLVLFAFTLLMPQEEPELSEETGDGTTSSGQMTTMNLEVPQREKLMDEATIYSFERSFTVAAIEVATSLISEVQYGFSTVAVGWILTCITVAAVILNFICAWVVPKDHTSRSNTMYWQAAVAVLATLFMLSYWPWWTLYLGDAIIIALSNTANGMVDGFAVLAAVPNTPYSREAYFNRKRFLIAASRFLAAPLVRGLIEFAGRNAYASVQFLLTMCGLFCVRKIWEILNDSSLEDSAESKAK